MLQTQCIAYKVPLYEIERARAGVPKEQLDMITEPKIFIAPQQLFGPKKRGKYARNII
ncbi:MAG: hypothetical protein ACO3YZ_06630 [Candidatus Nanopelagicaceae bacterium]